MQEDLLDDVDLDELSKMLDAEGFVFTTEKPLPKTGDAPSPAAGGQALGHSSGWYAALQASRAELADSGVDTYLVFNGRMAEVDRRNLRAQAIGDETYRESSVAIYANSSFPNNPNTRGLEHAAADFNEMVFNDGRYGPIIMIVDPRGIVRWHSRGFEHVGEPIGTLQAAIDFSLHALHDEPQVADATAPMSL